MSYSYLALGDSYTIGEAVLLADNFPYQTLQLLRNERPADIFYAPEIIAKTGWTTDELAAGISERTLLEKYDIVSLLIGVNNQYRGRSVEEFENEFENLLKHALKFSHNEAARVFVLSIPDWGLTPFAKERDKEKISAEIDQYNSVCKNISDKYLVTYIDITTSQRADKDDEEMVAADGLHPSKKEYAKWAQKLAAAILNKI